MADVLIDDIFKDIVETIHEPLLVLDSDLKVILTNHSFYEIFKEKPEETVGQHIYDLGNRQWDIPKLKELLEDILPEKTAFDNYEVEHDFATIGRRTMLLNARQIERGMGKARIILLAIEDITERMQAETRLKNSEEQDRRLFETADKGFLTIEKLEAMTSVCSVGLDMVPIPGDITMECLAGIIADEMAIGMINSKTTATRLIPVPGKKAGDKVYFGDLLGEAKIMNVPNSYLCDQFVKYGGQIPAPIHSMKN